MDVQERFDADKFNALMKLADFRFQRWRERRTTDWKLSLALWTLLVAAAAYLITHRIEFTWSPWATALMTALVLIILVIVHALFLVRNNWISNEMDIRTAFHFAEHAEKIVLPANPEPLEKRLDPQQFKSSHRLRFPASGSRTTLHAYGLEFLSAGFCQAQVLATSFFALVVFVVMVFG
jgi:hypothetical protein